MLGPYHVRHGILLLAAVICARGQSGPWRIGSNQSPPLNYWDDAGQPAGFAIEVVQAAAQRRQIPLQWTKVDGLPDLAFARNQVDLWPVTAILDSRRRHMYFSQPWWRSERALISRKGTEFRSIEDIRGRRLMLSGVISLDLNGRLRSLASAVESRRDAPDTLAELCRDHVDVAALDYRLLQQALLDRPKACDGVALTYHVDPDLGQPFGIAATFKAAKVADQLYDEIERMIEDGHFQAIARRWAMGNAIDPPLMAKIHTARQSNVWLTGALSAALAVSVTFAVMLLFLWRARRAAQKAYTLRGRFLANMSHELRTPLGGILGMSELALDTPLNPQQREYIGLAKSSAEHLLVLLNDILDFSKIEAGKMALEQVPFELEQAVAAVARAAAVEAYRKGIRFRAWVDPRLPSIMVGDPVRFRQILNNLTSNAVKFTSEGAVRVDVSEVERTAKGGTLRLTVSDTGVGVPADKQQHIFNAFAQADGLVTRLYGGTGLGLAITRELVRLMGGSIQLQSTPEVGSKFTVELPFALPPGTVTLPDRPAIGLKFELAIANPEEQARMAELVEAVGGEIVTAHGDIIIYPDDSPTPDTRAPLGLIAIADPGLSSLERPGHATISRPVFRHTLAGAVERLQKVAAPAAAAQPVARALRLLAAEDDPVNQMLIQRLLESAGHSATVVSNGLQALEALSRNQYDVVLMDVQMPEMDGLEAVARLRQREHEEHVARLPVVGLTAMAMKGDREVCLQAGMDECLTKPIHKKHLLEVLARVTASPRG